MPAAALSWSWQWGSRCPRLVVVDKLVDPGQIRLPVVPWLPRLSGTRPLGPYVFVVAALADARRAVLVGPGWAFATDAAAPWLTRSGHAGGV
jgi:hypothetical protein